MKKQTAFKIGSERQDAQGRTVRLCKTLTGKEQWRVIGEDGEPVKRGRKAGSTVLTEMTLNQLLQHVGGKKFASIVKAEAEKAGNKEVFSAKIPVSSTWSASDAKVIASAKAPAPAKVGTSEPV